MHFGKTVLMLARTLSLSKTVSDCGTNHYVRLFIKNKKVLDKLNGRFYKENETADLKMLVSYRDEHLIGKYILLRSPATCALHDEVCQKCYGYNANLGYDIADGLPAFGSEEVTKVVNQLILSAKHLLATLSEKIIFTGNFDEFFTILAGEIIPNTINNDKRDDIDDWAIIIKPNDIDKVEEFDNDGIYNTYIKNGLIHLKNLKTKEELYFQESNEKELYLTEECIELMKLHKGVIKLKDTDDDTSLFVMEITNNELTKPLYDIMNLLNKNKTKGNEESIDSMCQKLLDLLIDAGIDAHSIQGELIINRLIRSSEDIYERPDFSDKEYPNYTILTVAKALEINKSPIMGLSFQDIKRQLMSDETFTKKSSKSYLDVFYKKKIKTSRLFKNK